MIRKRTVQATPHQDEIQAFVDLINEYRFDFERLAYIVFPFGQKGHDLEDMDPYEWQKEEWRKLSLHLMNPMTRHQAYRLIISSGNGAAKTAFGAMTAIMLMYTQKLRARLTANTEPQLRTAIWPEYDKWFHYARYNEVFFEKYGTSIKAKNAEDADTWRIDMVTWSENSPASISGLHNKGNAIAYFFEEAAGIPAVIWDYTKGAFTETDTIKLFFAFANSDDPESKFEQNMASPLWHSRRIDTRQLDHIDKSFVDDLLLECGSNEDHDDFRVRVRGMPRKTAKDSIIDVGLVNKALERRREFDPVSVNWLPCILTCDPAWTGGDETVIWYRQGNYACMLEKFKLDKAAGQTHAYTYNRLCHWERALKVDAVFIDQGEGTALYTMAQNDGKYWELVGFGERANDAAEFKDSEYGNIRAQMYHETAKWLMKSAVLDVRRDLDPQTADEWVEAIRKQLPWTKASRHRTHGKKMAEPKVDIKKRIGSSPDVADGLVLTFARPIVDRLPEHGGTDNQGVGSQAFEMPGADADDIYELGRDEYKNLYG